MDGPVRPEGGIGAVRQPHPSTVGQLGNRNRNGFAPGQGIVVVHHDADGVGAQHVRRDSIGLEGYSGQRNIDEAGPQNRGRIAEVGFMDDDVDV